MERFLCACGAYLFNAADIETHEEDDSGCRRYFIKRPEWVEFWDLYEAQSTLKCFRCYKEVGEQSREGLACPCGSVIRPAFVIDSQQ